MKNDYSPSERDMQLSTLATAYANSTNARARNMIRGKAQKLINKTYSVESSCADCGERTEPTEVTEAGLCRACEEKHESEVAE